MGERGPAPEPTALRILNGNPGQRAINEDEPQPEAAPLNVPPPDSLPPVAKEEWRRLVPILQACGLLTAADLTAFAIYCTLFARWREAEDHLNAPIDTEGDQKGVSKSLHKTPNGHVQPSPWLTISRQMAAEMKPYLIEFGMTPAARARYGRNNGTPPPPKPEKDGAPKRETIPGAGKFGHLIGRQDET